MNSYYDVYKDGKLVSLCHVPEYQLARRWVYQDASRNGLVYCMEDGLGNFSFINEEEHCFVDYIIMEVNE